MSDTIVIVGAGQAGAWAARTLRDAHFAGRILLFGAERHHPYERPPLSKAILSGTGVFADCSLLAPDTLAALDIAFHPEIGVASIDPAAHVVTLFNGSRIGYTRLILCTGGHARQLAVPGGDLPKIFSLRTIDDALALKAALSGGSRKVAIIGGGWIGLEVAASTVDLGHQVTIVEAADRLCARSVPASVSNELAARHLAGGVTIHLGMTVSAIAAIEGGLRLALADGSRIDADVVIVGLGLVPNDALAVAAGLACDNGVLVDGQCRSSVPDIFAAGDVAVAPGARSGRPARLESWQNAQDQGIAAARAALGEAVSYDPLPLIWSEQYGTTIEIAGWAEAASAFAVRHVGERALFLGADVDGRSVAAVTFDGGRDFRVMTGWVRNAVPVDFDTFAGDAPLAGIGKLGA